MDHALLHQRRHAHGIARVVGEDQERAGERNEAAVQCDAVGDGAHAEFAHAVVDVTAVERVRRERLGLAPLRQVAAGEVGGAAEQFRQGRRQCLERKLRCLARGESVAPGRRRCCRSDQRGRVVAGQVTGGATPEFSRLARELSSVGVETLVPGGLEPPATRTRVPRRAHIARNGEGRVRPADRLSRGGDFRLAERLAVRFLAARAAR